MKTLTLFLFVIGSVISSYGQRTSDFKTGLAYPFVNNITYNRNIDYSLQSFPELFLEKPLGFKSKRDKKITLNPGVALMYFNEKQTWNGENIDGLRNLNHLSFNGYTKLLYRQKLKRRNEAFIYGGGTCGVHILTKTFGTMDAISNNIENPSLDENISSKGNDFYNSIYYGAIIGFQPNYRFTDRYKLSFEIAYYPQFVSIGNENANSILASILLGITG